MHRANESLGPEPVSAPMAWQTLRYGLDPEGFFADAQQRHGDVFSMRVLRENWTVLGDPAAVKETFSLGPDEANSGEANLALRPLIGTRNLLLLDGQEHLARRKLLLPPFHGERMRAYEETIKQAADVEFAGLTLDRPVAVMPSMQSLTFAVILRCIFGVNDQKRLEELGRIFRQMLSWVTDARRLLQYAALGPERMIKLPAFRRQQAAVDRELMNEIKLRRSEDLDGREDILSMMIQARDEEGRGLSDAELRDDLATLLVAGHETTATLLAWAVHELARDCESQERLARGEDGFAEAVVTETLRLRPPVPIVLRRLLGEQTIAGYRFPAGTTLAPCVLLVNRRPDLYPNPWSFDPSRFLNRKPGRSEMLSFGGSVRRCLGAAFAQFEARIVLEQFTQTFRFEAAQAKPERLWRRGPILVPRRGARVIARPR
jgi:cytochrome P450 family 135